MFEFKLLLEQIIEDNELEILTPSQEYTNREKVYMEGYNQALKDIQDEFKDHYINFMKSYHSFSLN